MKITVTAAQAKHLSGMLAIAQLAGDNAQARRQLKPHLKGSGTLDLTDKQVNLLLVMDAKVERGEQIDKEIGPFFDRLKELVKKAIATRTAEEAKRKIDADKKAGAAAQKKNAIHSARRPAQRRKSNRKKKQR